MQDSGGTSRARRSGVGRGLLVALLILIPLVGTLVPEFYNRTSPSIGGMPFFYWYQLTWVVVSVTVTLTIYRLTRSRA